LRSGKYRLEDENNPTELQDFDFATGTLCSDTLPKPWINFKTCRNNVTDTNLNANNNTPTTNIIIYV
jgi:hypothetical protein